MSDKAIKACAAELMEHIATRPVFQDDLEKILRKHLGKAEECWMATADGEGVAGSAFYDNEAMAREAAKSFYSNVRHATVRMTDVD